MNDTARYIIECAINVQAAQLGESGRSHAFLRMSGMLDAYAGVMDAGLHLVHRNVFLFLVRGVAGQLPDYYEREVLDVAIAQVVTGIEAEQAKRAEQAKPAPLPIFPQEVTS